MKTFPGFHPAGMLRMSNFVPDKIVKSTHSHQSSFTVRLRPRAYIQISTKYHLDLHPYESNYHF